MFWRFLLAALLAFVGGCAAPLNQLAELEAAEAAAAEKLDQAVVYSAEANRRQLEAERVFQAAQVAESEARAVIQSARKAYVAELKRVNEQRLTELQAARSEAEERIRQTCVDYPDLCQSTADPAASPAASDPAGAQPTVQPVAAMDFVDIDLNPRQRNFKLLSEVPKGWEFSFVKDRASWYLVLRVEGHERHWFHLGNKVRKGCWRFTERHNPFSCNEPL